MSKKFYICCGESLNTLSSRTDERVKTHSDGSNGEVQVNLAGLLAASDFTLVGGTLVTRYKRRSLAPATTRAPTWLGIQTEQIVNG